VSASGTSIGDELSSTVWASARRRAWCEAVQTTGAPTVVRRTFARPARKARENCDAATIDLSDDEFDQLTAAA
jgi:hypothetical protein